MSRTPRRTTRARQGRESPTRPRPSEDRWDAFAREYVIDHNGTRAAIRAGYSEVTASQQASRLLRNVKVRARVAELDARATQRQEVTAGRVVEEFDALSFYVATDVFVEQVVNGQTVTRLRPVREWPEKVKRAVSGIKIRRYTNPKCPILDHEVVEIKLHSKEAALAALGRRTGAIPQEAPMGGEGGLHIHLHGGRMGFERPDPELAGKTEVVVGRRDRHP